MSRARVYPEVRGARLASQLEREKALKVMKRKRRRKAKKEMSNVTKLQPKNKKKRGNEIAPRDRDSIVGAISRYGREKIGALLVSVDPNNPSPYSTIADLLKDPGHTWLSRNHKALTGLAQFIRVNCQESLKFPERSMVPLAREETALAPVSGAISPELKMFMEQQNLLMTSLLQVVKPLAAMHQTQSTPRQLPSWNEGAEDDADLGNADASPPREFKDHPTWLKRKILHDIHTRIGERIKQESGGSALRPHAEAWNRSYDAFHKETRIDIKARASKQSDRNGQQVRPIDLIEQMNELDRFYEIVKTLWAGWF